MIEELLNLTRAVLRRLTETSYHAAVPVIRAANTTQYTANDVVGGLITFPDMGPQGGRILLTSAELEILIASVPITATMTTLTLHLYNARPPSDYADNAAWDLAGADIDRYLGSFLFPTPVDLGSTLYIQVDSINMQRKLIDTTLYGYLVTTVGFTPAANSEVYKVTLHSVAV